jgi:hypothetical protein
MTGQTKLLQDWTVRVAMTWLLLAALALRALIAPGMMPAFAPGSQHLITICSSQGERTIPFDGGEDGQTTSPHVPCLFAATGFTSLGAVTGPVLCSPVEWLPFLPQQPADVRPPSCRIHHAHARGPPVGTDFPTVPRSAT